MADIFADQHARTLLKDKVLLLLGDSTVRNIYKDLILLISRNEVPNFKMLRFKAGESFEGLDRRTCFKGLHKGRDYEEGREFSNFDIFIEYHFITRCYTKKIVELLQNIKSGVKKAPDVIIMNSCLWDISRWGPNGVDSFKQNMHELMKLLKASLPEKTLFIWTTATPVSREVKGGLLLKQIDFMQSLLRFEVMEANLFCRDLLVKHGYDILDLHYYLRNQIHRRDPDGIHYDALSNRFITNLILTHISLSWNVPLPGNFAGVALERMKTECVPQIASPDVQLPELPASLRDDGDDVTGVQRSRATPKRKRGCYLNRSILRRGGPVDRQLRSLRGAHAWKNDPPPWQNGDQAGWWQGNQRGRGWSRPNDVQSGWENDEVWTNGPPKPIQHPRYPYRAAPKSFINDSWDDPEFISQKKFSHSEYANFDQGCPAVARRETFSGDRLKSHTQAPIDIELKKMKQENDDCEPGSSSSNKRKSACQAAVKTKRHHKDFSASDSDFRMSASDLGSEEESELSEAEKMLWESKK